LPPSESGTFTNGFGFDIPKKNAQSSQSPSSVTGHPRQHVVPVSGEILFVCGRLLSLVGQGSPAGARGPQASRLEEDNEKTSCNADKALVTTNHCRVGTSAGASCCTGKAGFARGKWRPFVVRRTDARRGQPLASLHFRITVGTVITVVSKELSNVVAS
jgi:hypothetical protein